MRKNLLLSLTFILILPLLISSQAGAQNQQDNSAQPSEIQSEKKQDTPETKPIEELNGAPQEIYQAALKKLQQKEYLIAKNGLTKVVAQDPTNVSALFNLGLAEYQLGEIGRAMARWQKALDVAPNFTPARRSLQFVKETQPRKELPRQILLWEQLRSKLIVDYSIEWFAIPFCLFLLLSGRVLFRYLAKRKMAQETESKVPAPSKWVYLNSVATIIFMLLFAAKIYDYLSPRALVVVKSIDVRTGPDENQASLFELFEGLEVIVQQSDKGWAQISYPGGMTGWVPQAALLQTSGRSTW